MFFVTGYLKTNIYLANILWDYNWDKNSTVIYKSYQDSTACILYACRL